ncbi:hypothetical protein KQX54_010899 [Cotesia glomerata]|uniref:Uncharacterized protein n=1 Tax=Cotesia glomerata TaxID=32391 RepID=A0AAV7IS40_COTGL|nr:hypothetical protein KQX54_010899 [Cotesia glomerata]
MLNSGLNSSRKEFTRGNIRGEYREQRQYERPGVSIRVSLACGISYEGTRYDRFAGSWLLVAGCWAQLLHLFLLLLRLVPGPWSLVKLHTSSAPPDHPVTHL